MPFALLLLVLLSLTVQAEVSNARLTQNEIETIIIIHNRKILWTILLEIFLAYIKKTDHPRKKSIVPSCFEWELNTWYILKLDSM